MVVQGVASAAATTIILPAHQPGDIIIVFARRASNTIPGKPTAGPTVPTWIDIQAVAGANTLAMRSAYCIATQSNHTSGTWGTADQLCVIVLRPDSGKSLEIGGSASGAVNNTQTIVYPALTFTDLDGSSWSLRCGTRAVADSEVGTNVPAGYTNQIIQPAGASALMAVHTRAGITSNPTADSIATAGTNAAYRAHTVEVTEATPQALTLDLNDTVAAADSLSPSLGLSVDLADSVPAGDSFSLAADLGLSLADTVALADGITSMVVATEGCTPDAICGTHLCGEAICGTWWACPKPAGLGLGGTAPQVITEDEQTPSAGLILATHPPGIVMEGEIDPPEAGLILGARVPDDALVIPPVVVSPGQGGLYLGTTIPGTIYIPPVVVLPGQAGLALGATVPLYRIDGGVAPFPAGLALGATPPTRAEKEWITAVPCEDLVLVSDPERTLVLVGAAGSGLDLAPDPEGELVLVGAATSTIVLDPSECR